jgi:hypothetical protein
MDIINWIEKHWVQIGMVWLATQNILKAIQDSLDNMPKGTPILRKISTLMQDVSAYVFTGNRPAAITNEKPNV